MQKLRSPLFRIHCFLMFLLVSLELVMALHISFSARNFACQCLVCALLVHSVSFSSMDSR